MIETLLILKLLVFIFNSYNAFFEAFYFLRGTRIHLKRKGSLRASLEMMLLLIL